MNTPKPYLPTIRFCWNCDAMLHWGVGVCADCVRAIVVGLVVSAATALFAWMFR